LWEHILAGDLEYVREQLGDGAALDKQRQTLIQGALLVGEKRWAEAIRVLAPASLRPTSEGDAVVRYRVEIMLAWARVDAGDDTAEIQRGLTRAGSLDSIDPALSGYLSFVAGQVAGRVGGAEALAASIRAVPRSPSKSSLGQTFQLAWRGAVYSGRGWAPEAIADLSEVERRLQDGVIDISDGTYYALLASAFWQRGQWSLAETKFRLARDVARGPISTLTLALTPLSASGYGDFEVADTAIRSASEALEEAPWPKAVESLFISETVRLHAGSNQERQATFLDSFESRFGSRLLRPEGSPSPLWLLHTALANIWKGDLKEAAVRTTELEQAPLAPAWVKGTASWLSGLGREAAGSNRSALAAFDRAVELGIPEMPLYRGHLFADRARVAHKMGSRTKELESRAEARAIYEKLGAHPFLQVFQDRTLPGTPLEASRQRTSPTESLSDRERDVATLVASGMSYGQIAKAMFVSHSTVSFHLQRIYAKLGINSRHDLSALLHAAQ
jgi:DNA-binding CsgD family transcriptional regulator